MRSLMTRLLGEDDGQDLVEYALLATFIGLVSIAALGAIQTAINGTYGAWNTNNNNNWQMPDPGAGGS